MLEYYLMCITTCLVIDLVFWFAFHYSKDALVNRSSSGYGIPPVVVTAICLCIAAIICYLWPSMVALHIVPALLIYFIVRSIDTFLNAGNAPYGPQIALACGLGVQLLLWKAFPSAYGPIYTVENQYPLVGDVKMALTPDKAPSGLVDATVLYEVDYRDDDGHLQHLTIEANDVLITLVEDRPAVALIMLKQDEVDPYSRSQHHTGWSQESRYVELFITEGQYLQLPFKETPLDTTVIAIT